MNSRISLLSFVYFIAILISSRHSAFAENNASAPRVEVGSLFDSQDWRFNKNSSSNDLYKETVFTHLRQPLTVTVLTRFTDLDFSPTEHFKGFEKNLEKQSCSMTPPMSSFEVLSKEDPTPRRIFKTTVTCPNHDWGIVRLYYDPGYLIILKAQIEGIAKTADIEHLLEQVLKTQTIICESDKLTKCTLEISGREAKKIGRDTFFQARPDSFETAGTDRSKGPLRLKDILKNSGTLSQIRNNDNLRLLIPLSEKIIEYEQQQTDLLSSKKFDLSDQFSLEVASHLKKLVDDNPILAPFLKGEFQYWNAGSLLGRISKNLAKK